MAVDHMGDASMGELAAFVALHEAGSFTEAAQRLHLSQPGFSARIFRLERAVGQRLIDRSVRPAALTAAGRSFLPYACALLRAMAEGRAAANRARFPSARPSSAAS
jgi:DNA-binding transcriptional LysR family regulator